MMRFMNILILLLVIFSHSYGMTLKERFDHSQIGDYVVTEQDKNLCLLFVRNLTSEELVIDELTFHEQDLPKGFKDWGSASFGKAYPLSWISFQFDRKTGTLEDAYNFNEKSWLEFEQQEVFLKGLLNLDLSFVQEKDRKKIGPTPLENGPDLRRNWAPPLVIQGVKYKKPTFDVYKGRWEEDGSILSKCRIEMYFSKNETEGFTQKTLHKFFFL